MATTSFTPSISFAGLASGLDVTSIISKLTQVAQQPVQAEQSKIDQDNTQLAAWQAFNSKLSSLQSAALSLTQIGTYNSATGTSTNVATASLTTQPGAQIGDHALTVTALAQAQKVVTSKFSSGSTALNLSGSFTLNGKAVTISASDALADVAVKINAAQAGVTASVVNVGPNDFRMTMTSNTTGLANSVSAADSGGGSLLSRLGLLSATPIRQAVNPSATQTGAASLNYADATQPVAVLKGISDGSAASGTVQINGTGVAINLNTDSLSAIAGKINGAGITGVTAQVVTQGSSQQLQILSTNTNSGGSVVPPSFTDSGNVLSGTGIIQEAPIRQVVSPDGTHTGAGSLGLGSATQTVANVLGLTGAASGTVQINGTGVAINLNTDSLSAIAGKINGAGITGVTAQVVGLTDANGNVTKQQLQIVGGGGSTPTFSDNGNILATLGVLQGGYAMQVTAPQDAKFNLDGLDITRASNTVGDVIPGASFKLLAGTAASPATTTLSITQNTSSIVQTINTFVTAFNDAQTFITQQNQFTPPAAGSSGTVATSPPLFGDSTLSGMQDQLNYTLGAVSGSNTLGSIGITLDTNNHLNVDSAKLSIALQTNPNSVSSLFSLSGAGDNSTVQYVAAGPKTQATNGAGYTVAITQPATQTSATAASAQTAVSTAAETLTFSGALFPSATSITLTQGNALQDTINQINANSSLNGQIYASLGPNGQLVIKSQAYGASTGFTVTSSQAADTVGHANSGIGLAPAVAAGQDVAGTINGEPAIGTGRTLTGKAGNRTTEGLQILVSATAAGISGHVSVTHGIADSLGKVLTQIMDPTNGAVIGAENSINAQITDSQAQIQKMQDSVTSYGDYLQQMFSNMETRISSLQSQGAAFAAQIGTTPASTSSTKK